MVRVTTSLEKILEHYNNSIETQYRFFAVVQAIVQYGEKANEYLVDIFEKEIDYETKFSIALVLSLSEEKNIVQLSHHYIKNILINYRNRWNYLREKFISSFHENVDYYIGDYDFLSPKATYYYQNRSKILYASFLKFLGITDFIDNDEENAYIKYIQNFRLTGIEINFKNISLSNLNLSYMELTDTDLRGVNLHNTNLEKANLARCNLSEVIFNNTDLRGVNFECANLNKIKFSTYISTDDTNFTGADLTEADFNHKSEENSDIKSQCFCTANFTQAKLHKANLKNTDLAGANLTGADLTEADLTNSLFTNGELNASDVDKDGINLTNADLRGANLTNVDLYLIKLRGVLIDDNTKLEEKWRLAWEINNNPNYKNIDFKHKDLSDIRIDDCNVQGINFSNSNLVGAYFTNVDFSFANFSGVDLDSVGIHNCNFTKANFSNTNFVDVNVRAYESNFSYADFSNARVTFDDLDSDDIILRGCKFCEADLSNSWFAYLDLTDTNFRNANLQKADLRETNLTNANLEGADLTGANLTDAKLINVNLNRCIFTNTKLDNVNSIEFKADKTDLSKTEAIVRDQENETSSNKDYELKIIKTAVNDYLNKNTSMTLESLNLLEKNKDILVWDLAKTIFSESGHKADLILVSNLIDSRIDEIKSYLQKEEQKQKELENIENEKLKEMEKLKESLNKNEMEIFEKLKKVICEQLDVEENLVSLNSHLSNDLNADGLDLIELVLAIEEEFSIEISDEEIETRLDIYTNNNNNYSNNSYINTNKDNNFFTGLIGLMALSSSSSCFSPSSYSAGNNCIVENFVNIVVEKLSFANR